MMRVPHDDPNDNVSRRSFLKSAATATGGLVIALILAVAGKGGMLPRNIDQQHL